MTKTPPEPATDKNTSVAQDGGAVPRPMLFVQHQYTKDLSFESPRSPAIFQEMAREAPAVDLAVRVDAHQLGESLFEVILHLEAKALVAGSPAFVLELAYGAVAEINVQDKSYRLPLLEIEAPRLMFPFARNIIADVTRDGGFPPLMLHPIDFAELFQKKQAEAQAASGAQSSVKEEALSEA